MRRKKYLVAAVFLGAALGLSCLGFWALRALPVKSGSSLPRELSALAGRKVGNYVSHVADISPSVAEAAKKVFDSEGFEMADAGGPWNATDFVVNRALPFRRLIWAVSVEEYVILHYEMGGLGHSWHIMVFGPARNERRECIWSGSAEHSFASVYTFSRGVTTGSIVSHPTLMH